MEKKPRAKRKPSVLTEKQEALKEALLDGKTQAEAATIAGYSPNSEPGMLLTPTVKEHLARARQELSDACQIRRVDIIEGIQDAIMLARAVEDPASMIRGFSEMAKILGLYAPEVKKVEVSVSQRRLQSKFVAMPDEDLLAMAEGMIIDAEPPREH